MSHSVEIDAPSTQPIKNVVVFKHSAEVTRVFEVNIKAGQNNIIIKSLPSSLDSESIRVQGLGEAVLLDVIHSPPPFKANKGLFGGFPAQQQPVDQSHTETESLRQLNAKKSLLEGQRKILDHEADILVNYAKSLKADNFTPEKFAEFLETFKKLGRNNLEATAESEKDVKKVEMEIKKEKASPFNEDQQAFKREAKVTVVIQSEFDGKVELSLTYVVPNAKWTPLYSVVAHTAQDGQVSPMVSLHCRASITQTTGEDWKNVALTLSTASPNSFGNSLPRLTPLKIKPAGAPAGFPKGGLFGQQQQPQQQPQQQAPQQNVFGFGQGAFGQSQSANNAFGQSVTGAFGQPSTGAFGLPSTNTFGQPGQTSLFGQPAPRPSGASNFMGGPPTQHATSLFGANTNTTAPTGFGLFGGSSLPTATGGLFGNASAPPAGGIGPFGPHTFQPLPNSTSDAAASEYEFVESAEGSARRPLDQAAATPSDSGPTATYQIEGKSTIPSDDSTHKVSIVVAQLQTVMEWAVVPKYTTVVYLQAHIKNTTPYPLLSGPVNIFLDGSYLSKSTIGHINPKEIFTCSFGPDPSVRVTYTTAVKKTTSNAHAFAVQTDTTTYSKTLTILNSRKTRLLRLLIREPIPVSEDGRVKVILKEPKDLATTKAPETVKVEDGIIARWADGAKGETEGKMEWLCTDVASGVSKSLSLVYEVHSPAGVKWDISH